jgi:hypothetical protein
MTDLATLRISDTVTVPVDPDKAYALVADVTRMGEWSPVCKACAWEEGSTEAAVGAWFTGKNVVGEREWETRCEIVEATPGQELTWIVGGKDEGTTRWSYRFTAVDGGTEIEESWSLARVHEQMAALDEEQVDKLVQRTQKGITTTLAAIAASC